MTHFSYTEVIETLREYFPHGHTKFILMCLDEMKLHSEKNYKYAFGGDPLGNFNRVAHLMAQYPKVDWATPVGVALVYALKQLDAVFWMLNSGHSESALEGIDACLGDVSIYAKLAQLLHKKVENSKPVSTDDLRSYYKARLAFENGCV